MTRNEITRRFPKASEAFIKANLDVDNSRKASVVESNPGTAPLGKKEVQGSDSKRFLVCITSLRKRLLDEDNLCEKYHVDLCRYAGVLPDDAPGKVSIQTRQRKCEKGEEEKIEIVVDEISEP